MLATLDLMRIEYDVTAILLPEDLVQRRNREAARIDNILQHISGTHGRKLVYIPDEDQSRSIWNACTSE